MKRHARTRKLPGHIGWRYTFALVMVAVVLCALIGRLAYIQVIQPDRLVHEGDLRSLRTKTERVERGLILDRNGEELAVSVPMQTVWVDPKVVHEKGALNLQQRWQAMSEVLGFDLNDARKRIAADSSRRFLYLARRVSPAMAEYVRELGIPGVYLKQESRRFYPKGEVTAHILGFTDIDDQGLEGIERSYNDWLVGEPGRRLVRKDRSGRTIESLEVLAQKKAPQNLTLTIDQRIQSLAYQQLKIATEYHAASSGSVVVVDIPSGEILAMVNTPSFNPNNREQLSPHRTRNRAITDTFEPGSTVKPLAVIAAMEEGLVAAGDTVDTSPGWMRVGGRRVQDSRNYGEMSLTKILQKSSNVGVSKLALSMPVDHFLNHFYAMGFGNDTGLGLLGESAGVIHQRRRWSDFEVATLSFGYGLTVTPLQLAQAYSILGGDGLYRPLSLVKQQIKVPPQQAIDPEVAEAVLGMLESVTEEGGQVWRPEFPVIVWRVKQALRVRRSPGATVMTMWRSLLVLRLCPSRGWRWW